MDYDFFLFTNLVRTYYPSYCDLDYESLFEKLKKDYSHYKKSPYYSYSDGVMECIGKYLDANPYRYTEEVI